MTRIYNVDLEEINSIANGSQSFISLKDDKFGIKAGDTLILQDEPEDGEPISEITRIVDFTYYEGLKQGWVICALKEPVND